MRIALYNLHFATLGGGERRTALLAAHFAGTHEVALFSAAPVDSGKLQQLFGIDVSAMENLALPPAPDQHEALVARWKPDLFINNSFGSRLFCPARRGIYMCMFPDASAGRLKSYQVITANSAFTQEWIAKRWRRQAEVVYSAVEPMGPPAAKKNIILNVGRFQADDGHRHFKHQDVLLQCFGDLRSAIGDGWEMHFAGTIGSQPADRAFAESLQRKGGSGVHFHFGIPQSELRDLYRSAALYWHATGCSDSAGTNPSRQEHFGMTVVEAMSAGAVPLAFRGGGPRETIVDAQIGFLWSRPDELLAHSLALIRDPLRREAMSAQCIERSRQFNKDEFLRRMDAIVGRLTDDR